MNMKGMRLKFVLSFFSMIGSTIYADEGVINREAQNGSVKYEIETELQSPMKSLAKNTFWGGGTGLLVGSAVYLLANPSKSSSRYFTLPMGIGMFGGTIYSAYNLLHREDIYIDSDIQRKGIITEDEKNALEKEKKERMRATVKARLDSPVQNAFYDSFWGGVWGVMMSQASIWLANIENDETRSDTFRVGTGLGILTGLGTSIVYNYIQNKRLTNAMGVGERNNLPFFTTYVDPRQKQVMAQFKFVF